MISEVKLQGLPIQPWSEKICRVFAHWTMEYNPIGSMYAIYANIYLQYTPVMLAAYTAYMDAMGNTMDTMAD